LIYRKEFLILYNAVNAKKKAHAKKEEIAAWQEKRNAIAQPME
jgi:hypothetical protein